MTPTAFHLDGHMSAAKRQQHSLIFIYIYINVYILRNASQPKREASAQSRQQLLSVLRRVCELSVHSFNKSQHLDWSQTNTLSRQSLRLLCARLKQVRRCVHNLRICVLLQRGGARCVIPTRRRCVPKRGQVGSGGGGVFGVCFPLGDVYLNGADRMFMRAICFGCPLPSST